MERLRFEYNPTLAVVKRSGKYRVSCMSRPYEEYLSFREVFARIHDLALSRPEIFDNAPLFCGLSEPEEKIISGMRDEICSSLQTAVPLAAN